MTLPIFIWKLYFYLFIYLFIFFIVTFENMKIKIGTLVVMFCQKKIKIIKQIAPFFFTSITLKKKKNLNFPI